MTNLYQDLLSKGYLDHCGMVSNKPHEPCDNYFLFTAIALKIDFQVDLYRTMTGFVGQCEYSPGLLWRNPDGKALASHDEYIGLSAVYTFFSWRCWEAEHWLFWDKYMTPRYWFGRFPWFVVWMRARAKGWGMFTGAIWTLFAIITTLSDKQDTSSKQLFWLMCSDAPKAGVKAFNWLMARKYPGGPKEMLTIYYGQEHPIAQHAPEKW